MLKTLFVATALMLVPSYATFAQDPSPTPLTTQGVNVPPVAVDYRANANRPLPLLTRVGIDANEQKPLTLREAITMALRNNKDIEVGRDNVAMAEADLLTAHGAYDPKFSAQSYFERIVTPATSFLSGASRLETSDITASTRLEGLTPKSGGSYRLDFSSIRQTSNSVFTVINPQYLPPITYRSTHPHLL